MTASQTYFDVNIAQSLIQNYGKTSSCHEANKACYPACHRSCLTNAVCYPPGPCIHLSSTWLQGIGLPWEDQYCIISPTRAIPAVADELSFPCYKSSAQRERTRKGGKRRHQRGRRHCRDEEHWGGCHVREPRTQEVDKDTCPGVGQCYTCFQKLQDNNFIFLSLSLLIYKMGKNIGLETEGLNKFLAHDKGSMIIMEILLFLLLLLSSSLFLGTTGQVTFAPWTSISPKYGLLCISKTTRTTKAGGLSCNSRISRDFWKQ